MTGGRVNLTDLSMPWSIPLIWAFIPSISVKLLKRGNLEMDVWDS